MSDGNQGIVLPDDPVECFAVLVGCCATGVVKEIMRKNALTEAEARSWVVHMFLSFACGEACRIAMGEGRDPDIEKWQRATSDVFKRTVEKMKEPR